MSSEKMATADEKFNTLLNDLDTLRHERSRLAVTVEEMRARMDAASGEADYFKTKFEQAMRAAKEREAALIEEGKTSATAQHNATLEITNLQKRCEAAEAQIKKERAEFLRQERDLMQQAEKHRVRADEERLERVKQGDALHALQTEFSEKIALVEKLDNTLRGRDKDLRLLRHETEILRARTEEAVKTETAAKDAATSAQNNYTTAVADYEKKVQRLEHELARQSGLLAEAVKERERSEFLRQEELSVSARKYERLQQQIAENAKRLHEEQERARELQANFAAARHDFSELQTQYDKLERKFLAATETARTDRLALLAEVRAMEKTLRDTREKMHEAEKLLSLERRAATTQVEQVRAQLRNAILVGDREKNELKEELTRFRAAADDVTLRAQNFDNEIANVRHAGEERVRELHNQLTTAASEQQKLTAALADETRRNQVLEDQVVGLRGLLEEMEKRVRAHQANAHQGEKDQEKQRQLWQEKFDEQQDKQQTLKSERDALAVSVQNLREKEEQLKKGLRTTRAALDEMKENVAASVASKAYHKEKQEALEAALAATRQELRETKSEWQTLSEKSQTDRENYLAMERQLQETHAATIQRLQTEAQARDKTNRCEIGGLSAERDAAQAGLQEERQRNQEMLQNLLAMRDELENAQNASTAAKNFLKEKLKKAEEELAQRKNELAQERGRRSDLEHQLRDLRQKMQFA